MGKVKNEANIKNPLIESVREQFGHRALWLWYICDETEKHGLTYENIGSDAARRCGLFRGKKLVEKCGTKSLTGLKRVLFSKPAKWIFEIDMLDVSDDEMNLHLHYCPLVKAWQEAGCKDEQISRLCSIARSEVNAIAESFGCKLEPGNTIANGSDACEMKFIRK